MKVDIISVTVNGIQESIDVLKNTRDAEVMFDQICEGYLGKSYLDLTEGISDYETRYIEVGEVLTPSGIEIYWSQRIKVQKSV